MYIFDIRSFDKTQLKGGFMDIDNLKDLILSELKERNLVDVTEEIE
ncbi:hypothetical protein IJ596_03025 [bacterium]|nr:hypothetical protein [bacterium]